MNLIALLESLISSIPAATELYQKIVPHISQNAEIPEQAMQEINVLTPLAQGAVAAAHNAVSTLVTAHTNPHALGGQAGQSAAPTQPAASSADSAAF